jgi:hypothetical protein
MRLLLSAVSERLRAAFWHFGEFAGATLFPREGGIPSRRNIIFFARLKIILKASLKKNSLRKKTNTILYPKPRSRTQRLGGALSDCKHRQIRRDLGGSIIYSEQKGCDLNRIFIFHYRYASWLYYVGVLSSGQ